VAQIATGRKEEDAEPARRVCRGRGRGRAGGACEAAVCGVGAWSGRGGRGRRGNGCGEVEVSAWTWAWRASDRQGWDRTAGIGFGFWVHCRWRDFFAENARAFVFGVLAFVLAVVLPNVKYSSNKSVDIYLNFF